MSKPAHMTPIDSRAFSAHHYDATSRELHITYRDGGTYRFDDVPAEKYATLIDNASPGSYLAREIKGTYVSTKVSE